MFLPKKIMGLIAFLTILQVPLLVCIGSSPPIKYNTHYFPVNVDHFGFNNKDQFALRYLVADQYWDKETGPVFFYAGNEGDILLFTNNTGFMWDLAPEFKALLVFAEHRYYGESMPYGNLSYSSGEYLSYLSSVQALADYAELLTYIRSTILHDNTPIIAFGGSYGGMLAAWFRMKYPNIIDGAIAASAPVAWFGDLTPCDAYSKVVTHDFTRENENCPRNVRKSWDIITRKGKTESGRANLKSTFKLCVPLTSEEDVKSFKEWIAGTWNSIAMIDYPYPTSFLEPIPGWPIKEVCKHLSASDPTDEEILSGIEQGLGVYYNSTGGIMCYNTTSDAVSSLGDAGWDYQACTEMVMPMCSKGDILTNANGDMFEPAEWNLDDFSADCQRKYGVTPRPDWAIVEYGGRDVDSASNIVFSNGDLDPWGPGGIHESVSDSVVSVMIEGGAHHLDLRYSNPADPQSVIDARNVERDHIRKWIAQVQQGQSQTQSQSSKVLEASIEDAPEKSANTALVVVLAVIAIVIVFAAVFTMTRLDMKQDQNRDSMVGSLQVPRSDTFAPNHRVRNYSSTYSRLPNDDDSILDI